MQTLVLTPSDDRLHEDCELAMELLVKESISDPYPIEIPNWLHVTANSHPS